VPAWWDGVAGPGAPIDTNRWCAVATNVLGGCRGSTGPGTPAHDGRPWGSRFPMITVRDQVNADVAALAALGVTEVAGVIGGSMGGMLTLSWAATYAERVQAAMIIASTARHSAQNIAFHEVGRQAIMADPQWRGGDYYADGASPDAGLAVARMAAHITYMSEQGLTEKFGRQLQNRDAKTFGFDADFQIESYLRHQGISFTDRFDANSYLYITRAMDYWDLAEDHGGVLANAFRGAHTRFCLVSFDTDWLYPTAESKVIVHALNAAGAPVSFVELTSPFGHDAFLMETPGLDGVIDGFVRGGGQ
jgi:homoserine O-acetyltransferase